LQVVKVFDVGLIVGASLFVKLPAGAGCHEELQGIREMTIQIGGMESLAKKFFST